MAKDGLSAENLPALAKGLPNLLKHIDNVTGVFGLPAVVAINRFPTDTEAELKLIETSCQEHGANVALSEVWGKGSEGGVELAREVVRLAESSQTAFQFVYENELPIRDKIRSVVKKIYGGGDVDFAPAAAKEIDRLESVGFGKLPVCMAKTQYSLSDDPKKLGRPSGFTVSVRSVRVSAGAGFIVVLTGEIMTMPGLPRVPAAEMIDVDADGKISGLF